MKSSLFLKSSEGSGPTLFKSLNSEGGGPTLFTSLANLTYSNSQGTVDKKIISSPKMRNNYSAIQLSIFQYCGSNIWFFSLASCKVIALNLLCLFWYNFFASLFISLSIVTKTDTKIKQKVQSDNFCYCRVITIHWTKNYFVLLWSPI